jgi:L-lactate dehydrogenase complex protein LldG
MTIRDEMLERIRAKSPASRPLPPIPAFDTRGASLTEQFSAGLSRMGGTLVEPPAGADLDALIVQRFPDARVICSATPEVRGTRPLRVDEPPAVLQDVDVGVVRALFGVAETGSVFVTETELAINAIAFLSQHLIVLLDMSEIVSNLHDAYEHPRLRTAGYAAFLTGPSATADIEGVLVRGAQGIRSLTVVAHPRPGASR